jgi:hypothetical protein
VLGLAGGSPGAVTLSEARARPIYPRIIADAVIDGYPVEKLFFFSEPDVVVTGVLSHPRTAAPATGTEVLLLERGTAAIPEERSRLEAILRQGRRVLVFDVRGTGGVESRPINGLGAREAYAPEFRLACDAMMAGTSTLGLRVLDVLRAYDYLSTRPDTAGGPIGVQGVGTAAIFAYLAAALEPGWSEVTLEEMLLSYRSIVDTRLYNRRRFTLNTMAWGFLSRFDLPDLAACIAPRPLRFIHPVNAYDEPAAREEWEQTWGQAGERDGWKPTLL